MKHWITEIQAINPGSGELTTFIGDVVVARTQAGAQCILNATGRGYMKATAELVARIPDKGTRDSDFESRVDYDQNQHN